MTEDGGPRARPFEVDPDAYPFADHWLERDGAALHYLDEGAGRPVVMLHGNPTWSFLYRDVVLAVRESVRCIVPDYPGFGMSDHPEGYGYTPEEHAEWIGALVDALDLDGWVLVAQDWGGPIGLSVAADRPRRVAGLVLCGTWAWPPDARMRLFSLLMGGPLGRYLHLRRNVFARRIVPFGINREARKTAAVLRAYTEPFPTPASRMGTWVFPRAIRTSADWLAGVERRLDRLRGRPVEMVWPMADPAFGRESVIRRWLDAFPDAAVDRVADANHYIQEDAPERIGGAVRRIADRIAGT